MADVNNRLRLQIVTQLDEAGIKATKEQVDQLELGLRRAGKTADGTGEKFGALEKSLGKLPGRIGEIAGKLGGLVGQATMVVGAFSTGVEIGNKICDVAKKMGLMSDPIAELKKENAEYDRQLQQVKESLQAVTAEEMKRFDAASDAACKAMKRIDDQTAAYFRQASSLKGLRDAASDAELMQIERSKFEDMKAYSDAGYVEAAEQIGRYYDVVAEELKAKRQIEAFDRESVRLSKEREQNEKAYAKAVERTDVAKRRQNEAEAALAVHRSEKSVGGTGYYSNDADAAKDDALEEVARRAAKDAAQAEEIRRKRAEKLETVDSDILARQMQRANLYASGRLAVDRAAAAYDDYVSQSGNPLDVEIDQNWANEMLLRSAEADQTQREILSVVKDFGARLERLLEVK